MNRVQQGPCEIEAIGNQGAIGAVDRTEIRNDGTGNSDTHSVEHWTAREELRFLLQAFFERGQIISLECGSCSPADTQTFFDPRQFLFFDDFRVLHVR